MKKETTKPRKKPKQARSIATVTAIIEASARILETNGFKGFNTNAVASTAGVSPGSLYQYFPNKQSLLNAVTEHEISKLADGLEQAASKLTGFNALDAMLEAMIAHQMKRPNLRRLLTLESPFLFTTPEENTQSTRVRNILIGVLKPLCNDNEAHEIAGDITAIITGMITAESIKEKTFSSKNMLTRVRFAVHGYLNFRDSSKLN